MTRSGSAASPSFKNSRHPVFNDRRLLQFREAAPCIRFKTPLVPQAHRIQCDFLMTYVIELATISMKPSLLNNKTQFSLSVVEFYFKSTCLFIPRTSRMPPLVTVNFALPRGNLGDLNRYAILLSLSQLKIMRVVHPWA